MKENYQIIQPIGEGSFGKVFKARRKYTGQIVAMKFITKKGRSEKDMNNLRQEISILKGLKHPNIILLLDSFETEHEFCLVTEYAHGELFEILEDDKNLPEKEVRKIAQQLVKSLQYLHSNRIIHRDLKPQNILFGSKGIIKICDFGFARSMSRNTMVLYSIKGTPLYMAPELINDNSNGYNHTVDLWSLGVILYELYVGQPPFYATSLIQLAKLIVNERVKYPSNMSPDFKNFLIGLLNKNPGERMNWPKIVEHPFVRETEDEKKERIALDENFNTWMNSGVFTISSMVDQEMERLVDTTPMKNVQGNEEYLNGSMWSNYELLTQEETGATQLRGDKKFLERLIRLYNVQTEELERKDVRLFHNTSVRVLCGMMTKSKADCLQEDDIAKDSNLHSAIIILLGNLMDIDTPAPELLSDIIRVCGFILKGIFNKNVGIQYENKIVSFLLNEMNRLMNYPDSNSPHILLQINTIKTISIFVNQAGFSPIKSKELFNQILYRQVYKDIIAIIASVKHTAPGSLHRACVHALAVMLHINQGEYLFNFPWKNKNLNLDYNINDWVVIYMEKIEKIKKNIYSALVETLGDDWISILVTIGNSDEEPSSPCKLSVLRILLHLVRCQRVTTKEILDNKNLRTSFVDVLIKPILTKSIDFNILGTTYTLLSTMIRQCGNVRGCSDLVDEFLKVIEFDLGMMWDALEGLLSKEPIVSGLCCMLLSEIIASGNEYKKKVFKMFTNVKNIQTINELLSVENRIEKPSKRSKQPTKYITKQDEIKKIEGSNFGCPVFGFHDGTVLLLNKLWNKVTMNEFSNPNEFYVILRQTKIIDNLFNILKNISNKADLSPRGIISLFTLLHDIIIQDTNSLLKLLFSDGNYKILAQFLQETLIKGIIEWPEIYGGGTNIASIVISQVVRILNIPYVKQDIDVNVVDVISREYSSYIVIMYVIYLLRYLNDSYIGVAVGFLSRLILYSDTSNKIFADQFMNYNGLRIIDKYSLLDEDKTISITLDVLSLVSHLARLTKDYYPKIQETKVIEKCKILIKNDDPSVRSKVCNLVGNICRHSDYFYAEIAKFGIISQAMDCCKDVDKNTRKFACFAVGNAGFHNDTLYDQLKPCIPYIVNLLKDEEEKTRANAAGALGNFVRNSSKLCESLIKYQALTTLLEVVEQDKGPGNSPKQIALFSIGNLCVYEECKNEFEKLNIRMRIDNIKRKCSDRQIIKYADRVINKLNE